VGDESMIRVRSLPAQSRIVQDKQVKVGDKRGPVVGNQYVVLEKRRTSAEKTQSYISRQGSYRFDVSVHYIVDVKICNSFCNFSELRSIR
jgi:hypothetical protein